MSQVATNSDDSKFLDVLERRARVRYCLTAADEALCWPPSRDQNEAAWVAKLRDISTSGIGLVLESRFPEGTLLEIELDNEAGNFSRRLFAQVQRTEQIDGTWLLGCEFVEKLSREELNALLRRPE